MFKQIGQLAGLLKNAPRIKEEMEKLQQRLGQITAEGDAGAGMVRIRVNGRMEMVGCQITEEALKLNDRELLEDLIKSATNQALEKARQLVAEETSKAAAGFGVSGLPDLSSLLGKGPE
jgi:DNA-binding YbaB/EbfC family protein